MVLTFVENTMYMHAIPLIKLWNFRKRKIHIGHHSRLMVCAMCVFWHRFVENLLKGPVTIWWFSMFLFFVLCRILGFLLLLKPKKHNGSVSLPSLMGNYENFYHIYPCHNFWVNGCRIGPEGSLEMVLSMDD